MFSKLIEWWRGKQPHRTGRAVRLPADKKELARVIKELYEIGEGIRDKESIVEYEVDGEKYRLKYQTSTRWIG